MYRYRFTFLRNPLKCVSARAQRNNILCILSGSPAPVQKYIAFRYTSERATRHRETSRFHNGNERRFVVNKNEADKRAAPVMITIPYQSGNGHATFIRTSRKNKWFAWSAPTSRSKLKHEITPMTSGRIGKIKIRKHCLAIKIEHSSPTK